MLLIPYHDLAVLDLHSAFGKEPDGCRVNPMFLNKNPRTQAGLCIIRIHRDGGLHDDGPVVHLLINQMDGCPGNAHAPCESLTLRV